MQWYLIALLAIAGLGVLYVVIYAVRCITRVGSKAESLIDQIKTADEAARTTPRSLTSVESFMLPQVMKDFPEYNPAVIAERVKRDARLFYESAAVGELLYEGGVSAALKENLKLPDNVAGGIEVHKVALTAYDRQMRDRLITYQAAVKYDGKDNDVYQVRLKLRYVAAYTNDFQNGITVIKCPNCSAPVPAVGDKVCRYCGAALLVSAGQGWVLVDAGEC